MQLHDAGGQLTSRPSPNATVSPGWINNDPTGLSAATISDPDFMNAIQAEALVLLTATGQTMSKTNVAQLYLAIMALRKITDTGTPNHLVGAPALPAGITLPALSAIPDGFEIEIIPGNTTTSSTPDFAWNGGSAVTITDPLGNALPVSAIQSGRPARLMKAGGGTPTWWLIEKLGVRQPLTGNITIYVNASTGSDSNTGLTSGSPFLTLQAARNAAQKTYDLAGQYTITFDCAGAFTAGLLANGPFFGQVSAANEVWSFHAGATLNVASGSAIVAQFGALITVGAQGSNFTISAPGAGACGFGVKGNSVILGGANLNFGACGLAHIGATDSTVGQPPGGFINMQQNYSISGSAQVHGYAATCDIVLATGITVTLSGTPAFSAEFAGAVGTGIFTAISVTFSGSATGTRYAASQNAVIATGGAGASYFPGSGAGATGSGGQYV